MGRAFQRGAFQFNAFQVAQRVRLQESLAGSDKLVKTPGKRVAEGLTVAENRRTVVNWFRSLGESVQIFEGQKYLGFGSGATGGRDGETYVVTNLNDSGPGSLREALSQPNRNIEFAVSGTIVLQSALQAHGNTTIDGFSAPAPGITLHWATGINSSGLWLRAHEDANNVIVRYLRLRNSQAPGGDGIRIAGVHDIVIDHCSISGWVDGGIDITDDQSSFNVPAYNITVSWCLVHRVGGARGSLISQFEPLASNLRNISLHFNMFWANTRLPQVGWLAGAGESPETITVDIRNNLFWGWGSGEATRISNGAKANIINNFYYSGAASTSNNRDDSIIVDTATSARAYVTGNKNRHPNVDAQINATGTEAQPFPAPSAPDSLDACLVGEVVLAGAGCRRPSLDAEDQSVVDMIALTPKCTPSAPSLVQSFLPPDPSEESALTKSVGKTIAETLALDDELAAQAAASLELGDTVPSPADAVVRAVGKYLLEWPGPFNPFFVEDPQGTGSSNEALRKQVGKVVGSSFSLLENLARTVVYFRRLTEVLTLQTALDWRSRFALLLADNLTVQDLTLAKQISKRLHDVVSEVDSRFSSVGKVVVGELRLLDTRPVVSLGKRVTPEVLNLTDQAMVSCLHLLVLSEALALLDAVARGFQVLVGSAMAAPTDVSRRGYLKKVGSSLSIQESPAIKRIGKFLHEATTRFNDLDPVKAVHKAVSSSLDLDDDIRRKVEWYRTLAEALQLAESLRQTFNRFLKEDCTVDGALAVRWQAQRALFELVNLTEQASTQAVFNRYLAELLGSRDAVKKGLGKILVETLNLQEILQRRVRFLRAMGEAVPSPLDSMLKSPGVRAGEALHIAENEPVLGVNKYLGELLIPSDAVGKTVLKQLAEALEAHDGLRRALGKQLAESLSLAEFTGAIRPFLAVLGDAFNPQDEAEARKLAFAVSFVLLLLESKIRFETVDREVRDQVELEEPVRAELLDNEFGA